MVGAHGRRPSTQSLEGTRSELAKEVGLHPVHHRHGAHRGVLWRRLALVIHDGALLAFAGLAAALFLFAWAVTLSAQTGNARFGARLLFWLAVICAVLALLESQFPALLKSA